MKFSKYADLFPLDEATIDELAADLKANKQQLPILTLNGEIFDGRRRYLGCKKAGIAPKFKELTKKEASGDLVALALSLNLHRRQLSATQKAMVAAEARALYEEPARERQRGGQGGKLLPVNLPEAKGDARDKAGEALGVSGKSVDYATKVLKDGTEKLAAACKADDISVSTAAKVALMPPEQQDEYVARAKGRPTTRKQNGPKMPPAEGERVGNGSIRAREAINVLMTIPKADLLREDGLRTVIRWCQQQLREMKG